MRFNNWSIAASYDTARIFAGFHLRLLGFVQWPQAEVVECPLCAAVGGQADIKRAASGSADL